MSRSRTTLGSADLVVVGAGIAGLAHAAAAHRAGLSVIVIDRAYGVAGSSVRGTGHIAITTVPVDQQELAAHSRRLWLELAEQVGLWVREHGTTVVSRSREEQEVLDEFAAERGGEQVVTLGRVAVSERTPVRDPALVGGVWLPLDLQVDPRTAVPALASWLEHHGVEFHWQTAVHAVEPGVVHTTRGAVRGDAIVVAVDHAVAGIDGIADTVLPVVRVDMVSMRSPWSTDLETPLQTAWSLAQCPGLDTMSTARALNRRLSDEFPELAVLGMRQSYAQRPDGMVLFGGSRMTGEPDGFRNAIVSDLIVDQAVSLFGLRGVRVTERWQATTTATERVRIDDAGSGVRIVRLPVDAGLALAPAVAEHVVSALTGINAT